MPQIRLLRASINLAPGYSIKIPYQFVLDAARREYTGLDQCRHMTRKEVDEFAQMIAKNWSVRMTYNIEYKEYTMHKPEEQHAKNINR